MPFPLLVKCENDGDDAKVWEVQAHTKGAIVKAQTIVIEYGCQRESSIQPLRVCWFEWCYHERR
jgi:hypothetical protein